MARLDYLAKTYFKQVIPLLERYFCEIIRKDENLSAIGAYWESGNQNEIDIVTINEYEKRAIIAEVKRNAEKTNINTLQEKAKTFVSK